MPEIETLTEEERDWLDSICDVATIKLLRLHDALQARVKELLEPPEGDDL